MTEYIGYSASVVLLISFMMRNMRTLRWINLVGCGLFIVYGLLIAKFPIVLTNAAIVVVNVYYLFFKKVKA